MVAEEGEEFAGRVELVTFYRQNKRGKPLKISREKYLRDDFSCGVVGCRTCPPEGAKLDGAEGGVGVSTKFDFRHFLLPDASFLLRQTEVLEGLENVILLQSVMEAVYKKNVTKYKQIRNDVKLRKWVYYLNQHSVFTYTARQPNETAEGRDLREFLNAHNYFQEHLSPFGVKVLVLSDVPEMAGTLGSSVLLATGEEYVGSLTEKYRDLQDKLCMIPYSEDEAMKKYQDFSYPSHLELTGIKEGVKAGKYIQGVYRTFNFFEGFLHIPEEEDNKAQPSAKRLKKDELTSREILLQGLENVNRACDGDIIAVELLPESEWSVPSGLVVLEGVEKETPLTQDKLVLENEETDADLQEQKDLQEEEEVMAAVAQAASTAEKQRTGRVVGVIKRKWKLCCGVIRKSLREGSNLHFFFPDDRKLSKIRIETRNVDRFEGQKLVALVDAWPVFSKFPVGHIVKVLGPVGDVETETAAILYEHGIPHEPFSKAVESCLPHPTWTIPQEEYEKRRDFRSICVCSVDPPGCTDIDDALHCRRLEDGMYEVGVHIADVSYFVKPLSALDDEAAKRGTTVYLADRRINMIPPLLSTNLASLHTGVDKLVFSVIYKMSPSGEVLSEEFTRGVVNTKAALTYAQAQTMLNSKAEDELTLSLKGLSYLAQILKRKRFENGALSLSATEVNEEGEADDDCEESHSMVEEFMLLANCSVAAKMLDSFREYSLLRRHPIPPPSNFDPLLLAARASGLKIIVDQGSKALNESLESQPNELKSILRVLTTRCMTQAVYCCSGTTPPDEYLHFGLAAKIYTHFTSPIRRYADLVVHRLLGIAVGVERPDPRILDANRIHEISGNINIRHKMAQYASRASYNIHKSKILKGKGEEEHMGYVLFVKRNALQVMVPKYAMEGYIFLPKDMEYEYNEKDAEIKIASITFRPLDRLTIGLSLEEGKDKVFFRLIKPQVPGLSEPRTKAEAEDAEMEIATNNV